MIDELVFVKGVQLLCSHFDRFLLPEVTALWKEYLDQRLSTGQFETAVKLVLLESRFFPTAKELVEVVRGDAEANALHEWELCVKAAGRGDRAMLTELSSSGQSALHLVGGLYKLGMATEEQLNWIKKEFMAVWKTTKTDALSLPPSLTTDREPMERVPALSQ